MALPPLIISFSLTFEFKIYSMRIILVLGLIVTLICPSFAQLDNTNRSTMYFTYGRTGANLREFNQMLGSKGLSPMRNSYTNVSFGYQTRFNDFILGAEIFQNSGPKSVFNGYELDYRTTRAYLNIGFAFTEEGRFQLVHYMSIGTGFLNFQMLRDAPESLDEMLQNPSMGYVIRDGNIHKSSLFMRGFLTEIGFHMGYDLNIPGREEALELIAKFGYSFSPFEDSWKLNGISFNTVQSGAFLRLGAGISLPDHNFFYKDASIGIHLINGIHYTQPTALNQRLVANGLQPLEGRPNNWGVKMLGYSKAYMYGLDFYNLGMGGRASDTQNQTLNSFRLYGNGGMKFFDMRNLELGAMAGLGYANLRYTLLDLQKPDFPRLFEEPNYDGFMRSGGVMGKPEVFMLYSISLAKGDFFDIVLGAHAGYEVPLSRYQLGDLSMYSYMANPYFHFSLGIRP